MIGKDGPPTPLKSMIRQQRTVGYAYVCMVPACLPACVSVHLASASVKDANRKALSLERIEESIKEKGETHLKHFQKGHQETSGRVNPP